MVSIELCIPAKIRYFLLKVEFAIHTVLQCDIVVSRSEVLISVFKFELIFYLFIYYYYFFLIRESTLEFHNATLKSSVTVRLYEFSLQMHVCSFYGSSDGTYIMYALL